MLVEHIFDFDRGDVFTAGNDDVLGAVLDDDITVLIEQPDITGMKPAAGKGLFGGLFVLEITLHHDIAAEHHLADRLAVARHLAHGFGIEYRDGFLQRVGHALPALALRALIGGKVVPTPLFPASPGKALELRPAADTGPLHSAR